MSASLEKVIILTKFYPPCNLTASYRASSWTKYLHVYGYFPVVFCKNYVNEEDHLIEKNEFSEIHYISYAENIVFNLRMSSNSKIMQRMTGFINYLFDNSIAYNGIKQMEKYISEYIIKNNVKKIIATAPIYAVFGLASNICKKHNVKWIADYRDDWTSSELEESLIFKLKRSIDLLREKKYLRSCTYFTSVSPYYVDKITNVIGKKGYLIENGFEEEEDVKVTESTKNDNLNVLYPGLLYPTQKVDIISSALDFLPLNIIEKVKITFLGTNPSDLNFTPDFKKYFNKCIFFQKRVERNKANEFLKGTDLLLFLTHSKNKTLKGIPSSKLYDYIRLKKPVLVCPSDHDIVEEKLLKTGQGVFCNTPQQLAEIIKKFYLLKVKNGSISEINIDEEIYYSNTRRFQTEMLAKVLNNL